MEIEKQRKNIPKEDKEDKDYKLLKAQDNIKPESEEEKIRMGDRVLIMEQAEKILKIMEEKKRH